MAILGLDWGLKRVGFATADDQGIVVTPRGHFVREGSHADPWSLSSNDQKKLSEIMESFEIEQVVLGLPLNLGARKSDAAEGARTLKESIEKTFSLKVTLVQEALSSWAVKGAKDQDAAAAGIILEDYFRQRAGRSGRSGQSGFLKVVFGLILALAALVFGYGFFVYKNFSQISNVANQELLIDVAPGTTWFGVKKSLEASGIPVHPLAFRAWVKLRVGNKPLRAGEWKMAKQVSAKDALEQILATPPLSRAVTFKEGWNIYDYASAFLEVQTAKKVDFLELTKRQDWLVRMGVPKTAVKRNLEGFLFPETYSYQKYDEPEVIVSAMLAQFEKRALPLLKQHPWGQTAEGRYRLLTLASIVEKESGIFEEQPVIASVFWNRLQKKMRLESDPTIIYGLLPDFDGNIRRGDIRREHPYNTYVIRELPPGPIANPGESAIRAVVNPASTDYLFFVSRGDGSHVFSKDYKTHRGYVIEYQINKRRKNTSN